MFIGAFLSFDTSFDATLVDYVTTENVQIENGVFDELYLDSNTSLQNNADIPEWGYSTILHANFKNNILAGNVDFTLDSVSALIVKKRKQGTYKWIPLYERAITSAEDFNFILNDPVVASMTSYEFAAIPVINGAEGTYQITTVDVEFDGAFIIDPTNGYQVILNLSRQSLNRNNPSTVLEPVNSKYAYVNYYSQLQYDKFSISGLFAPLNRQTCEFEIENAWQYRKNIREFLTNRRTKVVKFYDGEMYLAAVVDQISESIDSHPDNVNTTVNFVEVGDPDNNSDLYYHGFSNYLEAGV